MSDPARTQLRPVNPPLEGEILPPEGKGKRITGRARRPGLPVLHVKTQADVDRAPVGRSKDPKSKGLYLIVTDKGVRRWALRFTVPGEGKPTEMGLGELPLKDARTRADALRIEVTRAFIW